MQAFNHPIAASLLAALGWASVASAQLTSDQAACVLGLGRSVWKIEKQVAKQASSCLAEFADGAAAPVEACLASDPTGKLGKLSEGARDAYDKLCTPPPVGRLDDPFPPFGATDATTVIAEGARAAVDLAHELFGANLDGGALSTDADAAFCQRALWKAMSLCELTRLKESSKCQKDALDTAASKADLRDACLGAGTDPQPDPKGKIAKKCSDPAAGIPGTLTKKCDGQDLDALVPGCAGAADVAQCLQRKAACRACLAVSQAQDLDRDCDLFDDGSDNASCDRGPITVLCQAPTAAAMLQAAAGATVNFQGQVSHPTGIEAVTVNATSVPVAADGSFGLPVVAKYGLNFVDVVATNAVGEQRAVTCTFLAAGTFAAENLVLANGAMLRLAPAAIDDGVRGGSLNSLGDVLWMIVNNVALRDTLNAALTAANPLKPSSCDQEICFLGICTCFLSSQITYVSLSLPGPQTASLGLVANGLASGARVENPAVRLRVTGQIGGISYDTTGWVTYDFAQVSQTSDLTIVSGRPDVSLRPGTHVVTMGAATLDFPGVDGVIVDLVATLASGTLRTAVANTIGGYVRDRFNAALDDLLSGIRLVDTSSLSVPRIDGGGNISVSLGEALSSMSITTSRALFGMGTRFTTIAAHAVPSLGLALPAASLLQDPFVSSPVAASTHVAVVNQALHALWRGGLLATTVDAAFLGAVPAGTSATVQTLLPPVVLPPSNLDNKFRIGLGAVQVTLTYPGVFDDPVVFELGADTSGDRSMGVGWPQVTNLVIDALHRSDPSAALDGSALAVLDAVGAPLLVRLVNAAVESAMLVVFADSGSGSSPQPRAPEFPISAPLLAYGLPTGSLGLVNPLLDVQPPSLVLRGGFGRR